MKDKLNKKFDNLNMLEGKKFVVGLTLAVSVLVTMLILAFIPMMKVPILIPVLSASIIIVTYIAIIKTIKLVTEKCKKEYMKEREKVFESIIKNIEKDNVDLSFIVSDIEREAAKKYIEDLKKELSDFIISINQGQKTDFRLNLSKFKSDIEGVSQDPEVRIGLVEATNLFLATHLEEVVAIVNREKIDGNKIYFDDSYKLPKFVISFTDQIPTKVENQVPSQSANQPNKDMKR